jgi:hypothetical protein
MYDPRRVSSPTPSVASSSFRSPYSSQLLPPPATTKTCMSAAAKRWKYLRRLLHFRQMDFEFAFWQMFYLLSAPRQVYRNFQYRKQTKLQFARDDPAFLVLLAGFLVLSSAGFAFVLGIGFWGYLKFLLYVIFVDCIGVGLVIASGLWALSNKYLLRPTCQGVDDVEWGFAFDVHLNAFFPILIVLHFIQLFFYHAVISGDGYVAAIFGNALWMVALGYYVYITFLGYSSLKILQKTKYFLYPIVPLVLFIVVTMVIKWNLTKSLMDFYHYRVMG